MINKDISSHITQALMITGASIMLAGCSLDDPGKHATQRLEVQQSRYSENIWTHDIQEAQLQALAGHYRKHGGEEAMTLTVQYDPNSAKNTAMNATHQAAELARSFKKQGVDRIRTEILPVEALGDHSKTLVSYDMYTAHAPQNCQTMPGTGGSKTDWKALQNYGFGCTIESKLARQVAHPRDLMGRGSLPDNADGRRAGNIVETYRTGQPNEALEGQQATED